MIKKILPIILLTIAIIAFFFRLFWPQSSIFMIPDFGASDVLHLNLALKHILSTSLKNHTWPLWTPYLAGGFPILAEGQIGTFYLPNLVLFRFLPTVIAYNLNLMIAFFLSAVGTYLFIRKLNLSTISALWGALIFTFSGFISVHLHHFNLIQAVSLLPLLFWSFLLLWRKPSFLFSLLFAFLLSQQIFTGHFYIVFITLLGISIFLITLLLETATTALQCMVVIKRRICHLGLSLVLTSLLAAIQLLPTIELMKLSGRSGGLGFDTVTSYPYPFAHLITFIFPYAFGNPSNGSYPPFSQNWGIFWENTAYIGILPLLLALSAIFFYREKIVRINFSLFLISILLVLGKNSPLYFIFSFPPFNFFRVPSKFLLLSVFSLTILSSFSFEQIKKWLIIKPKLQKWAIANFCIIVSFFTFFLIDEYRFSYNYPPVSSAKKWIEPPTTAKFLESKKGKVASIGAPIPWNKVFLTSGWQDLRPYLYFRNSLYPNYNVLFNIPQNGINTGGLIPRRVSFFNALSENIDFDEEKNIASISALAKNILSLSSTRFLISSFRIKNPDFKEIKKINPEKGLLLDSFYFYENKKALPRSYLSHKANYVETVSDAYKELASENFLQEKKILVEDSAFTLDELKDFSGKAVLEKSFDTKIVLKTESNSSGILVLTDTYYPGWKVSIDKKPSQIITVNLVQRGVFVPSGTHEIQFSFRVRLFEIGKKITIFSHLIIFLAVFLDSCFSPHTNSENIPLSFHPENKQRN